MYKLDSKEIEIVLNLFQHLTRHVTDEENELFNSLNKFNADYEDLTISEVEAE